MSTPAAAPQITTTSPTGHTTTIPSPPAPSVAQHVAPTSIPATTSVPPPATRPEQPSDMDSLTYNEHLNAIDRYWKFKSVFQIALILSAIVGIASLAWALSTTRSLPLSWSYGYDSTWALPWGLITFSISLLWCALCILRFVLAKRTVPPGLRVSMELLLWLGFLVTALFTTYALVVLVEWGADGDLGYALGYSSSYGDYVLLKNDTWVWQADDNSSLTYSRSCNSTSSSSSSSYYYGYNAPTFRSCAEQDAFVNTLWHEKGHVARVELAATVTQWLSFILHFVLFVWACVDCHIHRRRRVGKDAEKLAAGIVEKMVRDGAVVHAQGAGGFAGAQPGNGYAQGGYVHGVQQMGSGFVPQIEQRPALPPRPVQIPGPPQTQSVAGPSGSNRNGKAPVQGGGVAASYYEPGQ